MFGCLIAEYRDVGYINTRSMFLYLTIGLTSTVFEWKSEVPSRLSVEILEDVARNDRNANLPGLRSPQNDSQTIDNSDTNNTVRSTAMFVSLS